MLTVVNAAKEAQCTYRCFLRKLPRLALFKDIRHKTYNYIKRVMWANMSEKGFWDQKDACQDAFDLEFEDAFRENITSYN